MQGIIPQDATPVPAEGMTREEFAAWYSYHMMTMSHALESLRAAYKHYNAELASRMASFEKAHGIEFRRACDGMRGRTKTVALPWGEAKFRKGRDELEIEDMGALGHAASQWKEADDLGTAMVSGKIPLSLVMAFDALLAGTPFYETVDVSPTVNLVALRKFLGSDRVIESVDEAGNVRFVYDETGEELPGVRMIRKTRDDFAFKPGEFTGSAEFLTARVSQQRLEAEKSDDG